MLIQFYMVSELRTNFNKCEMPFVYEFAETWKDGTLSTERFIFNQREH